MAYPIVIGTRGSRLARWQAEHIAKLLDPYGTTVSIVEIQTTSNLRRRAQILHRRPDLQVVPIRGNVETRLRKLDEQGMDALILAQAGLERLGLAGQITEILDPSWMVPAVGQGALGLECRTDDAETGELLRRLGDFA